jgi:hypothetical protein
VTATRNGLRTSHGIPDASSGSRSQPYQVADRTGCPPWSTRNSSPRGGLLEGIVCMQGLSLVRGGTNDHSASETWGCLYLIWCHTAPVSDTQLRILSTVPWQITRRRRRVHSSSSAALDGTASPLMVRHHRIKHCATREFQIPINLSPKKSTMRLVSTY